MIKNDFFENQKNLIVSKYICTHGRIKKYNKMWVYGRYKAPAYPTRYPDKVHRHPSDTRFEKWKISQININEKIYFTLSVLNF